jgi:UDP-N-acetylmuramoyl-tripeptide--D-alanyl-D-alanine ligase
MFDLNLQVRGRHMVANVVAALAVSRLVGMEPAPAIKALASFGAPEGRGETTRFGPATRPLLLVDESYNANVASMHAAMEVFASITPPGGEKVLVLGDMLELGAHGEDLHRSLKADVLATGATKIFLVGSAMRALADELGEARVTRHSRYIDGVLEGIVAALAYGDAVMVKGSKGVRLGLLVEKIKRRFGAAA